MAVVVIPVVAVVVQQSSLLESGVLVASPKGAHGTRVESDALRLDKGWALLSLESRNCTACLEVARLYVQTRQVLSCLLRAPYT